MRSSRRIAALATALFVLGCSDDPTQPNSGASLRVVSGSAVTDTIDALLVQALAVEVRGPHGQLASDVFVRFESRPVTDTARRAETAVYVCALSEPCAPTTPFVKGSEFATGMTDADGRVRVAVRLGSVTGTAVVRIIVPEFSLADSVTFTVLPGAAVRVRISPADTLLHVGATLALSSRVEDRYGNVRPEIATLEARAGNSVSLNASTGVVTAVEMGTQVVIAQSGSFRDSSIMRVAPSGRLVVWSPSLREIRLINIDGTAVRTLASTVSSDQGTFPRFGANRQTVTLHMFSGCCALNGVVVLDTANTFRRDITNAGFLTAIATRQLPNGVILVVGNRTNDPTGEYSLFSVDANNMVTKVAVLPGAALTYGGADISHDGSRVAYLALVAGGQELRVFTVATGVFSGIDPNARAPRWSLQGDRVAFLVPVAGAGANDGTVAVINSNGSGRRALGTSIFSPGLAWSPDGTYIIGRSVVPTGALRMLRVSDAAEVLLRYRHLNANMDYYQPDWR